MFSIDSGIQNPYEMVVSMRKEEGQQSISQETTLDVDGDVVVDNF
jgi:hypothetical protein